MNAARIAVELRALGVPVISSKEGNDEEDGEVNITDSVHVQVPTYGSGLMVVKVEGEGDDISFLFYDERKDLAAVVHDIRKAMKKEKVTS